MSGKQAQKGASNTTLHCSYDAERAANIDFVQGCDRLHALNRLAVQTQRISICFPAHAPSARILRLMSSLIQEH
jgi:hypothetical protein